MLVIAAADVAEAAAAALPDHEVRVAHSLLAGVWAVLTESFSVVLASMTCPGQFQRAIQVMREYDPGVRLIVCCPAFNEPRGRKAVDMGAHDYVLEPLLPEELRSVIHPADPPAPAKHDAGSTEQGPVRWAHSSAADVVAPAPSSPAEIEGLTEVLRRIDEGAPAALDRLSEWLRNCLGASAARIRVDELQASSGAMTTVALSEPLRRGQEWIGEVVVGPRVAGAYDEADRARLGVLARLVEMTYSVTRRQHQLCELVWSDDLSGLRNRRYFDQRLSQLVERARDSREQLTVLMFDIDEFKHYNDTYGHPVGDRLIQEMAQLLTHTSRESDVVARYGGDEFAVLLWEAERPRVPGSQHPTDAHFIAQRFCRVIHEHKFGCLGPSAPGPVTISGGLASFPWDGTTAEELLQAADQALLHAKQTGKNRIQLAGARIQCDSAEADESRGVPPRPS